MNTPRYVAVHEAGHAVAGWVVQKQIPGQESFRPFHCVVVRSPEEIRAGPYIDSRNRALEIQGIVEASDRYQSLGPEHRKQREETDPRFLESARCCMEADVVVALAGPIAEAKYRHRSRVAVTLEGGRSDLEAATRKAADFARNRADLRAMMTMLYRRSLMVVREHWPVITSFSDALLAQGTIDVEEALPMFEAAMASQSAPARNGRGWT
jgi:hypothetical protein